MATFSESASYRRDIVSRITRDDPQAAETLLELMVLTDPTTPIGAAEHLAFTDVAYEYTDHRRSARDQHLLELKERLDAIQADRNQ